MLIHIDGEYRPTLRWQSSAADAPALIRQLGFLHAKSDTYTRISSDVPNSHLLCVMSRSCDNLVKAVSKPKVVRQPLLDTI